MKTFGGLKGFQRALKSERETGLPEMEETVVAEGSEAQKAPVQKLAAMAYLTLTIWTEIKVKMIAKRLA